VIRMLRLDRAGVELITPDPALTTLGADGQTIVFHPDPVLTAAAINTLSAADAARWQEFVSTAQRAGQLVGEINRTVPPAIDDSTAIERWNLLRVARRARKLGRQDLARIARWLPMPVADVVGEWFAHDLLKAAISAHAILGNFAGPLSGGTGGMLIQRLAEDASPVGSGATARGGPGALTGAAAAAAERLGAQVRTNARAVRIESRHSRVTGVVLDNGDQLSARTVVSAVDPRHTFLELVEPEELTPTFLDRVRNFRTRGVTAKVNLALSSLPDFKALHGDAVPLRGRFLIAPTVEYLERAFDAAKYGDFSPQPWLELSLPSVIDPSLAPEGSHVMSIYAHFAPRHLRGAAWPDRRDALYKAVMRALLPHVPNLEALVVNREVLTPEDLEQVWGLSGGHIFHGESALDQTWLARPFLGWARYRTPIEGLYLASAGTHPGGGLTGGSGLLAATTIARELRRRK
jgi:phytoene dehydrogenase-like protein